MNIGLIDGKWMPHVQVRRQKHPELVEVIDRSPTAILQTPDSRFGRSRNGHCVLLEGNELAITGEVLEGGTYTLYTRIWMGVTPPKGAQPGYCAVVGEEFDGEFGPKQRRLFVLDEGVCIDGDPSMALIPDLLEAVSALKDIYFPVHERESAADSTGGDRRLCIDPRDETFLEEMMKLKWGIIGYFDEEDGVGDTYLKERFPFWASRDRVAPVFKAPYADDEDYLVKAVESLLSRGLLHHHTCCEILSEGQYRTPLKALGLVCLALQTYDWQEQLADPREFDGYPVEDPTVPHEEVAKRLLERKVMGLMYLVGSHQQRRLLEREGRSGFLKVVADMTGMDEELLRAKLPA